LDERKTDEAIWIEMEVRWYGSVTYHSLLLEPLLLEVRVAAGKHVACAHRRLRRLPTTAAAATTAATAAVGGGAQHTARLGRLELAVTGPHLHVPRAFQQSLVQRAHAVSLLLADLEVDVGLPQQLRHVQHGLRHGDLVDGPRAGRLAHADGAAMRRRQATRGQGTGTMSARER